MYLKRLTLHNFKNYESAQLEFSAKVNCFVGENAAGKTNLLDAIYYLSFCKSYFNPQDNQNIRHDQEFFSITGEMVMDHEVIDQIQVVQRRNQKKIFRLNKKEYQRLADHIGRYPLVMISPYDRDLINEGSEVRRRFIDSIISQYDPVYLDHIINYQKALAQRNTLLKTFGENKSFDYSLMEIWDQQLITLGHQIFPERKKFINSFLPLFHEYFRIISGERESASVTYISQLNDTPMDVLLRESLERDRILKFTTSGIHKDDLEFTISEQPVKKFASQGQQKSFVIALRLAQYMFIRNIKGYKPLILLDDIFDKLDDKRVEQLIRLVAENTFGQVFITDTQLERIEHLLSRLPNDNKIFRVVNGTVSEITATRNQSGQPQTPTY